MRRFSRQRHGNLTRIIIPLRRKYDVFRLTLSRSRKWNPIRQNDLPAVACRDLAQAGVIYLEARIGFAPAADALLGNRQRAEWRARRTVLVAKNLRDSVVEKRRKIHRL